jgi:hypothetical protein
MFPFLIMLKIAIVYFSISNFRGHKLTTFNQFIYASEWTSKLLVHIPIKNIYFKGEHIFINRKGIIVNGV